MNFCSNICKRNFIISNVQVHQKEDLSWGRYPISICCFCFSPHSSFFGIILKIFMNLFPVQNRFHGRAKYAIFIGPIIALPCLASPLASALVKIYLKWPWLVKIHTIFSKVTQPLLALPAVVSFDSHVVDVGTKQKPPNWRRNKSHVVVVVVFIGRRKQKPCCWCRNKQKPHCSCWRKTKAMLLMSEQNKCRGELIFLPKEFLHIQIHAIFPNVKQTNSLAYFTESRLAKDTRNCQG